MENKNLEKKGKLSIWKILLLIFAIIIILIWMFFAVCWWIIISTSWFDFIGIIMWIGMFFSGLFIINGGYKDIKKNIKNNINKK